MAQQKESNGTWSFYGKLPKDENGKRKNYKRRGFKSKKAAKLAEAERQTRAEYLRRAR